MVKIKRKPHQIRIRSNVSLDLVDADNGMLIVFAYRGGLPVRVIADLTDAQVKEAIRYMAARFNAAPPPAPLPEPEKPAPSPEDLFDEIETDVE